jgi:GTP diphosphokinase / guanosine-3',5'-bis(diphosphate) 3'-diphosphatase
VKIFNSDKKDRDGEELSLPGHSSILPGTNQEKLGALLAVCETNLGSFDRDLIIRAYQFASEAHTPQVRKSGEPYFTHPYAVAMIVAQEIPLDDVSVVSALLHDILEDCPDYSYEDLASRFGTAVADIVDGATKISNILKSKEVTKAESYRKLLVSMIKDIRVILIKFADRLHNMRTLEFVNKEQKERIAKETMEIYAPLAHRFGLGRLKWELEDLSFKYLHEAEFRQLKDLVALKRRDREDYIKRFSQPIKVALEKADLKFEISGRPKHLYSIYKKMIDRYKTIDEVYDLLAIRIILDSEDDKVCYLVYAVICEIYTPVPERYKNYIALPKSNGYKSIHTSVVGPDGKIVEVQIRTRAMHEIAEKGIAAHWAYKEKVKQKGSSYEEWLMWAREILELQQGNLSEDEKAKQLFDDIKNNLYQDEIVVFTPKGELIVLPSGATPVDFAFAIHSEIGIHTIGAKVNQRIVPLNRKLHSGDQVEVITSRNQRLSPDWEQFVVTNRARMAIKRFITEQAKEVIRKGREKLTRKTKKLKLQVTEEMLVRAASVLKFQNTTKMMIALGNEEIDIDELVKILVAPPEERPVPPLPALDEHAVFEQFATQSRTESELFVQGEKSDVLFEFARCCSPLPGDNIIGFVTIGHGIKIHRENCLNIQRLLDDDDRSTESLRNRLIEVAWPVNGKSEYLGGIRVEGDDRPGILNEIALAVTSYLNTNIRSVNINVQEAQFQGAVLVMVNNLKHLSDLIERLKKVKGVTHVERYIEQT